MRGELTRETRTRMTECSLSSRSKEENGWNGCTESRRICGHHIFRRGDIHVARDTAGAAAAANLHAGTMRPASGRHKWRPYVFPYTGRTTGLPRRGDIHVARDTTGRTTGLPRRGDIHVARDTAGAVAGAFTGGARFADPADRRCGQGDRKNSQGDRNFCRTDCFSRQGGRGGKGRQGKAST